MWLLNMYMESRGATQSIPGVVRVAHLKGVEGLRYTIVDTSSWLLESLYRGNIYIAQFGYPELKAKSHEYVLTQRPNTTLKRESDFIHLIPEQKKSYISFLASVVLSGVAFPVSLSAKSQLPLPSSLFLLLSLPLSLIAPLIF